MAGGFSPIHESHLVISEPITGLCYTKQDVDSCARCVYVCGDTNTKLLQHARRGASPSHMESHPKQERNERENKRYLCKVVPAAELPKADCLPADDNELTNPTCPAVEPPAPVSRDTTSYWAPRGVRRKDCIFDFRGRFLTAYVPLPARAARLARSMYD